jgi:hypothetical protein
MRYEVRGGRVQTWSLETHAVDHCNLRCAQCCQLSPHMAERFLDADGLREDLRRAAAVLEPRVFKFTGGEPFLHPQLAALVEVAKASGVAPRVQVTSNGLLAAAQPDALFEALDQLKVSLYPEAPLPARTRALLEEKCARFDVALEMRPYEAFQAMTPEPPFLSDAETAVSFEGCWLKHRCHLLLRGWFYCCSRPPKLQPYLAQLGHPNTLASDDGVDLSGERLLTKVLALLEREAPLASCRSCLGGRGEWAAHRQLDRGVTVG